MNINEATQLRDLIAKQCGFGVETPRTADPNERNETGETLTDHTDHRESMAYLPNKAKCDHNEMVRDPVGKYGYWMCAKCFRPYGQPETQQGEAVQACSAGEWPEDMGGNWTPDRIEANYAFSDWLDSHGDSLPLPESFEDWLKEDSIFIE